MAAFRRILRMLSNYVDPSRVKRVIKHPEIPTDQEESREMTFGCTDLLGFTTMVEMPGEQSVPLLRDCVGNMVATIRANHGYVSHRMGDGLFFVFNDTPPDPDHALHAVRAVLAMRALAEQTNLKSPRPGPATLTLAAGLSTGEVIVQDSTPTEFQSYSATNSAYIARGLESANRHFGTSILACARTIELLNGQYLVRPIGKVRLPERKKALTIYEPLCRATEATAAQRELAEFSSQIVSAYQSANFAGCIDAADRMKQAAGKNKFADLYREVAVRCTSSPIVEFDGQVVIEET